MLDLFDLEIIRALPPGSREWVIRIVLAVVVFVAVLFMRRLFTWAVMTPLRSLTRQSETDIDDTIADIVEPALRYIVIAIAMLLSTTILEVGNVEIVFIGRLARTLIVVGIGAALFQAIDLIRSDSRLMSFTGLTIDQELMPFVRTGLRIILIALLLVVVLQEWEYNVSGLIAGLGLGGLAFSLAAQDTVSNLFGFSTIVTDRPFVVGEYISADGVEGTIERVGVRSTKVRTLDQSLVIVPNSKLSDSIITNWSRLAYRRYNFTVGLTYNTTNAEMRNFLQAVRDMLSNRDSVQKDTIIVRFTEFSASSLDVLIRCNVDLPDWAEWTAEREEINLAVMDIVSEMGLSMAFPSRSLYIEQFPTPTADDTPTAPVQAPPPSPAASSQQQDTAEDAPSDNI